MFQTTAAAEMYRCQTSDGRVTFTDTPINLSDDCKQIKETPSNSNQPVQNRRTAPRPVNTTQQQPADKPAEQSDLESWTSRASTLVDDYHNAVKRRYRESRMLDKRKATRDVAKTKEDKRVLLEELKNSTLNRKQREEIRKILNEIP
jgi:ribosome-binding protein aMBF1 (putative translation factor)